MVSATSTSLLIKYHVRGLSQIALIGTAFAALRLIESPSTLTFFVFESALAATLGLFLSARAASSNPRERSGPQNASGFEGRAEQSANTRLQRVAVRLGISPIGETNDLLKRVRSELSAARLNAAEIGTDEILGTLFVDRTVPRVRHDRSQGEPSEATSSLRRLAAESNDLISLAEDLNLGSTSHRGLSRAARKALGKGQLETAISHLETRNGRLRARLGALVGRDLSHRRGSTFSHRILTSVFFCSIGLALLVLSRGLYVAPLAFYFLVAAAAASLSVNVHVNANERWRGLLFQTVVLAMLVKFHFFYLNPYLYSSDSFTHFLLVQGIATTGHVSDPQSHYYYFPSYHVFGFAGVSLTGLPLEWFGIFAFVSEIATIPVIYLVGRHIATPRVGLFAAILTLFSIFGVLPVIPLPSLFGLLFLALTIYALIKSSESGSRAWLALFWISALGALFSHPITGLVLGLALLVRFVSLNVFSRKTLVGNPAAIPLISYGVVYGAYLAFIASVSFDLFVKTMFAPTFSAALATTPSANLQTTSAFLFQSALAASSIAVVFFFASYGMFSLAGISSSERRYFLLLALAFVLIPAVEIGTENFRGQSSRLLSYMVFPLVLLGGHGVMSVNRLIRNGRRVAVLVVSSFFILAFVASSSYLTTNDERTLYEAVPAIPTHITSSALSSRDFLALDSESHPVFMDFGSFLYFHNGERARNRLATATYTLDQFNGSAHASYVVLNEDLLAYGSVDVGGFYDTARIQITLQVSQADLIYDAGTVRIFFVP